MASIVFVTQCLHSACNQTLTRCLSCIPGKFACRILIQGIGYALPVTITVPVVISLLITFCGLRNSDPCYFSGTIPDYLFFESPRIYYLDEFLTTDVRTHFLLKKLAYRVELCYNVMKGTEYFVSL
jgi:hypothetical protein